MQAVFNSPPALRHTWRPFALLLLAVSISALATLRSSADDATLPDARATKTGKPLRFRAAESVELDRDDQEAATHANERFPPQASSELGARRSADETGLLTQIKNAPNSALSESRKASRVQRVPAEASGVALAGYQQAAPPPEPVPPSATPDGRTPVGAAREPGPANVFAGPTDHVPIGSDAGQPQPPGGDGWPHDYLREQLAEPLHGASWCNEPFHLDWFIGMIRGTEIIRDHVDQNVGVIGGIRLGWDYDCYWGIESRLAFSSLEDQLETAPLVGSADKVILWDTSLLYYPWGDSRCRPYLGVGLGLAEFQFEDDFQRQIRRNLVELPIGVGLKYRLHDWLVLRADITDNLALGSSGLETMNNFSFTTGMEYRFGGCHRSYWPWEPAGAH